MKIACIVAMAFLALGCRIVDLPDLTGIEVFPTEENSILLEGDPIGISFPFAVDRPSTESLLLLKDLAGTVPGIFRWEGNTLYFLPQPALKPGFRYTVSFSGTFQKVSGELYPYHRIVPFFYKYREETAPIIQSIVPPRGSILGPFTPIQIQFNRPMDPASFQEGFSLSPKTPYQIQWTDSTQALQIVPSPKWQDRTLYTLSFSDKTTDLRGMPLSPPPEITFLVQEDAEPPHVVSVEAALNDGIYFPSLGTVNSLRYRTDALRITFSEPMDPEQTRSAVYLSPNLSGSWSWLEDHVLLFLPNTGFEAGVSYTLTVRSTAEDRSGNKILPYPPLTFTPKIELLSVELLLVADGKLLPLGASNLTETLSLSPPTWSDYTLRFTFMGGAFTTDEEKHSVQQGILLACIFPPSSPSPIPVGYSWVGGNQLSISYTGFIPSTATEHYYYLLTLRGGKGGIQSSAGNVLPLDLELLLTTRGP